MDKREALEQGYVLEFIKDKNKASYEITGEIGRGGSCIVYDACYQTNTGDRKSVRIKELYPVGMRITRGIDGLHLEGEYTDSFEKTKVAFAETFKKTNELFSVNGLTNSITNTIDFYNLNNTCYVVTVLNEGTSLDKKIDELSLHDRISTALSVAKTMKKIHEAGYLYFDLKPENVFVFPETTELVQLFDFDTLVPKDDQESVTRISYTRGFAPVELMTGRLKDTGEWTDTYEIGALLYWMITGTIPNQIQMKSVLHDSFDFTQKYRDRLFFEIERFFDKTLAPYYKDRFGSDDEIIASLELMKYYSDPKDEFIISSDVRKPVLFVGRESESDAFEKFINDSKNLAKKTGEPSPCLVNGLGGIGKSTFIREYVSRHRQEYDSVLWLYYDGDIKSLLIDDLSVRISTVTKSEVESKDEYYKRKIAKLKDICAEQKVLVIVDNFYSNNGEDFTDFFSIGWDCIFITREKHPALELPIFSLGAVSDTKILFERCLGRTLTETEEPYFTEISSMLHGHTLTIKLIAKQIRQSGLTFDKAAELVKKYDLPAVGQEKDDKIFQGKILSLLTELLNLSSLSDADKAILKDLSCVSANGMLRSDLEAFSENNADNLINLGWVEEIADNVALHPVIMDVIRVWKVTALFEKSLSTFMGNTAREITHIYDDYKKQDRADKYRMMYIYRLADCIAKETQYHGGTYNDLVYSLIQVIPQDEEDKMITMCESLLSSASQLAPKQVLNLHYQIAYVYDQQGDPKQAYHEIKKAFKAVGTSKAPLLISEMYWDLAAEKSEMYDYRATMHYLHLSRNFARIAGRVEGAHQLAFCYIREAHWLMQVFEMEEPKRIRTLISKCGTLIRHFHMTDDIDLLSSYYSDKAFYLSLYGNEADHDKAVESMERGIALMEKQSTSDFFHIENIDLQRFTIYLYLEDHEKAKEALDHGMELCRRHLDEVPYQREIEMLRNQEHCINP